MNIKAGQQALMTIAAVLALLALSSTRGATAQTSQFGGYYQQGTNNGRFGYNISGANMRASRPDPLTTSPQVDAEGIRHFPNGRHFDLNTITASDALDQARLDNPRFNGKGPFRRGMRMMNRTYGDPYRFQNGLGDPENNLPMNNRFGGNFGGGPQFGYPYSGAPQYSPWANQGLQPGVQNYGGNQFPAD